MIIFRPDAPEAFAATKIIYSYMVALGDTLWNIKGWKARPYICDQLWKSPLWARHTRGTRPLWTWRCRSSQNCPTQPSVGKSTCLFASCPPCPATRSEYLHLLSAQDVFFFNTQLISSKIFTLPWTPWNKRNTCLPSLSSLSIQFHRRINHFHQFSRASSD